MRTETAETRGRPAGERAKSTMFGRYLDDMGKGSFTRAAEELEINKVYVSQLACGDRRPSLEMAWTIEQWSRRMKAEGRVSRLLTMQSWFEYSE